MATLTARRTDPYVTKKAKSAQRVEARAGWESDLGPARLAALDESSAGVILSQNLNGIVLSWNKGAERMLGHAAREMVGRSISLLIPTDRRDELEQTLNRIKHGKAVEAFDTVRVRKDGRQIDVSLALSPIRGAGGRVKGAVAIMRDITDRKRLEKALIESEARFQAILDHSPAMIFLKDPQGRYLQINRQFAEVFQLTLKQIAGKTDAEIFPPNQAAAIRANDLKVIQAAVPMVFDEVVVQSDGLHTTMVTRFPLYDTDGKFYAIAGIATDFTERRRLEAEVLRISEREQQRIAQDLHDGLGQHLTGIVHLGAVLQAKLAERSLPEASDAARIVNLLDEAVAQTRTLARGLHPVQLEATGLMSSLEQLAALVSDLFKTNCRFECPLPVSMPDNVMATHLYRIAQEATNNAIKHGRASQIKIDLAESSDIIALTIQNNGVVISKRRTVKEGLGLRIMQYRAELIGGSLVIDSDDRCGTTVICTVPKHGALFKSAAAL